MPLSNTLVITGPRSAGKTSVSRRVAEAVGVDLVSSDTVMDERLPRGLDETISSKEYGVLRRVGRRVIRDVVGRRVVFDLAGGSLTDDGRLDRDVVALLDEAFVVGLLPDENDQVAVDTLFDRERGREHFADWSDEALYEKTWRDYEEVCDALSVVADDVVYGRKRDIGVIADDVIQCYDK